MNQFNEQSSSHDAIWLLLPWYVNGRANEQQRVQIDTHLRTCQACRDEVLLQRKLHQAIVAGAPEVERLPSASLRRLLQKMDDNKKSAQETAADVATATSIMPPQRAWLWHRYASLAASLTAIAALATSFALLKRTEPAENQAPADYYTVTSAASHVQAEVIHAVFTADMLVTDMEQILHEAHLHIVAGPSSAGVYSLARTSTRPVNESLLQLRQHQEVLLAEPTATDALAQ